MKIRIYRTKQRCAHGYATPWWVVDAQGKTAAFTTWCFDLELTYLTPLGAKENNMHYRNGREARNGDKIVKLEGGKVVAFGVLHSATPGNDYCNGNIAVIQPANDYACMCDCLHVDDVGEVLKEKGLDERPEGK
jgi:hypothetical protein